MIEKPKSGTKIMSCSCEHKYQDDQHGKGQRVHNRTGNEKASWTWRCTVCGDEK